MTKAEKIRTMTNEEMAKLFHNFVVRRYDYPFSYDVWMEWLEQEIDDETAAL